MQVVVWLSERGSYSLCYERPIDLHLQKSGLLAHKGCQGYEI